jgi:hypothetical protein
MVKIVIYRASSTINESIVARDDANEKPDPWITIVISTEKLCCRNSSCRLYNIGINKYINITFVLGELRSIQLSRHLEAVMLKAILSAMLETVWKNDAG